MTPQFRAGVLFGFALATVVWVLYYERRRRKDRYRSMARLGEYVQEARGYPGYAALLPPAVVVSQVARRAETQNAAGRTRRRFAREVQTD